MTPARRALRAAAEPRYLRPEGNRRLRRRRRTRAVLRVSFWIGLGLAGLLAAGGAAAAGWRFVTDPGKFPLEEIIVEGGPAPVREEVAGLLRPLEGRNLFGLDLEALELRVRSNPWVSSVRIRRRLPDALLVALVPRRVEALFELGGEIRMIGSGSLDLGRYEPRWAAEDQPVITGLEAGTREEVAGRLGRALGALGGLREAAPRFVEQLSSLDVSREDRLTATLKDFAAPVYLHPSSPERNLERLDAVRARIRTEGVDVEYLDLRFRDRIAALPVREGGA